MVVVTQAPNIIERLVGVLDSCGIALNLFTTRLERDVGTQTHLLQVRPVCEAWSKVMDTVTSDTGGISSQVLEQKMNSVTSIAGVRKVCG